MAPPNITDFVKGEIINSEPLIVQQNKNNNNHNNCKSRLYENDTNNNQIQETVKKPFKQQIVWTNVIIIAYIYIVLPYGHYLMTFTSWSGIIFLWVTGLLSGYGITAGAHRLWAHKTYKAKLPLRILLMILQTFAFQNCIHEWVRDHRVHHKFTDTDADPHNAKRGLFFSHVGWLMVKKHPDVKEKGKLIDMSDIEADPVVMWQKRNFAWFMPITAFFAPMAVMCYLFGDPLWMAWHTTLTRWSTSVNVTWLLNSAAHKWGWKPYDKSISPTDTALLGFLCFGEGWHNYHHVFPWDYKTSELVDYTVNFTNCFIDIFAKLGWAYDMKTVSEEMVRKRVLRTGDGSHRYNKELTKMELQEKLIEYVNKIHDEHIDPIWGWDDKDMDPDDKKLVKVYNRKDD